LANLDEPVASQFALAGIELLGNQHENRAPSPDALLRDW